MKVSDTTAASTCQCWVSQELRVTVTCTDSSSCAWGHPLFLTEAGHTPQEVPTGAALRLGPPGEKGPAQFRKSPPALGTVALQVTQKEPCGLQAVAGILQVMPPAVLRRHRHTNPRGQGGAGRGPSDLHLRPLQPGALPPPGQPHSCPADPSTLRNALPSLQPASGFSGHFLHPA